MDSPHNWTERPLGEITEHILTELHGQLREKIESLLSHLRKLTAEPDGAEALVKNAAVLTTLATLRADLEHHIVKEELLLFPWLRGRSPESAGEQVNAMLEEHRLIVGWLDELDRLTDAYTPPPGASASLTQAWKGLAELDAALRDRIRLENEVLFVRALVR